MPARERDLRSGRACAAAGPQRAKEPNDIASLAAGEVGEGWHPGGDQSLAQDGRELFVCPGWNTRRDIWSEFAAVSIRPVTPCTSAHEHLLSGVWCLDGGDRACRQHAQGDYG
jgi:hypothetical protein